MSEGAKAPAVRPGPVEEYLALNALADTPLADILAGFGERSREAGLPVARLMVGWRLLDPLYLSQTLVWSLGEGIEAERVLFKGSMESERFRVSPVRYLIEQPADEFRRRLEGANEPFQFPVLQDLADAGMTDYLIVKVGFGTEWDDPERPGTGVILSFASDAPGGFTDEHVVAIHRLKHMLALAVRMTIQTDSREVLARTYLGTSAGRKVLDGQIMRGQGQAIDAVIWYCDLRGSTALCERLGMDRYLPLLNDYFGATASPVVEHGGEVLDFIGDAVLAIFPLDDTGVARAVEATGDVLRDLEAFRLANQDVLADRPGVADVAGIAIATGRVVYGNIGIPARLTFSVIGPTVNRVARIEGLTKVLHEPVLVTGSIAEATPDRWLSRGAHLLDGVTERQELFALREPCLTIAATSERRSTDLVGETVRGIG